MKNKYYNLVFLFLTLLALLSCSKPFDKTSTIALPSIFSNDMVLQAHKPIKVWGLIDPITEIEISINGNKAIGISDSTGKFIVDLDEMEYGGPYELEFKGKINKTFKNVMIGEVWLCSGQSNMAWQVSQVNNSSEEIENANFENIRLFTVPKKVSNIELEDCEGSWVPCDSRNIRSFSAVGYFFGREIHQNLNIPIGLIHSSWGGTPIESWMKKSTLSADSNFIPIIKRYEENIKNFPEKIKEYEELVAKIQKNELKLPMYQVDKENKGIKYGWDKPDFNDNKWDNIELPGFWEGIINKDIDGSIWFRKNITIPNSWNNKILTIELGSIDDFDKTYLNGKLIGETDKNTPNFWTTLRKYEVDNKSYEVGQNTIAIRVFDHYGEGGFSGLPSQMKIYIKDDPSQMIELAGQWKYMIENELNPNNVTGPGGGNLPPAPLGPDHPHTPSGLFNGMINPISPFAMKGFIWYQGESNAGRAYQYRKLLPAMINDWRDKWNDNDLYVGIVQLANFMPILDEPIESDWAELREAQFIAAKNDPLTGLAVTIDIGEADDIHPKNKQDVGKRLAYWALNQVYEADNFNMETNYYSGPVFKNVKFDGNKAFIEFDHIADGLRIEGSEKLLGFTIAGEDKNFVFADAKIEDNKVVVWSEKILNPVSVRYAWANNPICNLYNSVKLPAVPFRTDEWKGVTYKEK